jgi:hypothetical protein
MHEAVFGIAAFLPFPCAIGPGNIECGRFRRRGACFAARVSNVGAAGVSALN